ncbi:MAG: hypothetical protein NZM04_05945 [Methylacidiphilales bacterium]|nr:hypothetical protein [Candidatus Methylacidiphilales bacterium]MDW8349649.1 hypothetical protein [Verrucomicrobiae bacterium]
MPFHSEQLLTQIQAALRQRRLAHAYLLIGQTTDALEKIAHAIAQIILPTSSPPHPDLHIVAPSGKARVIKIDQIRALENEIYLKPLLADYKLTLILEADRLCQGQATAANAFLKTLEEPPPHTLFILTTTQPNTLLETIRSRCLNIFLHTPPPDPLPESRSLIEEWFSPHQPHRLQPYHRARILQNAIEQIYQRLSTQHEFEHPDEETAKALAESAVQQQRSLLLLNLIHAYSEKLHTPNLSPSLLHYYSQSIKIIDQLNHALELKVDPALAIEYACWQLYRIEKQLPLLDPSPTPPH